MLRTILKSNFFAKNSTTKNAFSNINAFCLKRFSSALTSESFANGTSTVYIENLYLKWLSDPNSVDISWQSYFTNVERNLNQGVAYQSPPTIDPSKILN